MIPEIVDWVWMVADRQSNMEDCHQEHGIGNGTCWCTTTGSDVAVSTISMVLKLVSSHEDLLI